MIGLTIALQVWISRSDSTVSVVTSGGITTTTTSGGPPPAALVATCLGGGVLLLLAGAFYGRITKVSWNGVEVGLTGAVADAVKDKATEIATAAGKPDEASNLTRLSTEIAQRTNGVLTLDPHDLAELSVQAAARQLDLL